MENISSCDILRTSRTSTLSWRVKKSDFDSRILTVRVERATTKNLNWKLKMIADKYLTTQVLFSVCQVLYAFTVCNIISLLTCSKDVLLLSSVSVLFLTWVGWIKNAKYYLLPAFPMWGFAFIYLHFIANQIILDESGPQLISVPLDPCRVQQRVVSWLCMCVWEGFYEQQHSF